MYKSIIVPIDVSHAEKAPPMLDAAKVLLSPGGKITCLNVVQEIPTFVTVEIPADLVPKLSGEARDRMQSIVADAGVEARVEIRSGHPAQTILDVAEEIGADLVIIGSHKPGLEDYFLGSTAARVVRHANCHVLVQR